MKSKKQKDAEFIAKLKTLTIGTGTHADAPTITCNDCGKAFAPGKFLGAVSITNVPLQPRRSESTERSFSA